MDTSSPENQGRFFRKRHFMRLDEIIGPEESLRIGQTILVDAYIEEDDELFEGEHSTTSG